MQRISDDTHLQGQSANQVFKNICKSEGFKGLYHFILKPFGKQKEDYDAVATIVVESLAGICTSLVIYPIDVIKSHMQMAVKKSEFQMIRNVILSNDSRVLYSGLLTTMMKTVPATGVLLLTVELSKSFYRKYLTENPSFPSVSYEKFFFICDFVSGWTAGLLNFILNNRIYFL